MNAPVKLDFGQWFEGRSHPIWVYDEIPSGMRPAALRDLIPGRQVLYLVEIGPDKGKYYSGFFVGEEHTMALINKLKRGIPIFVKQ